MSQISTILMSSICLVFFGFHDKNNHNGNGHFCKPPMRKDGDDTGYVYAPGAWSEDDGDDDDDDADYDYAPAA